MRSKVQKNRENNRESAPNVMKRLVFTSDDDAISLSSDSSVTSGDESKCSNDHLQL